MKIEMKMVKKRDESVGRGNARTDIRISWLH